MQSPQTSILNLRRWTPAILALAVAGIMGLLFLAFGSGGPLNSSVGGAVPTATLTKVQLGKIMQETQQAEWQEHQLTPKPTLPPNSGSVPSSCPIGPIKTSIGPWDGLVVHEDIVNVATIAPSASLPFEYVIYAGAIRANPPQQGVLIVLRQPEDPCASHASGSLVSYYTPYQKGAVTLTQISGDNVIFSLADGGTGSFDYITGKYS